MKKRSLHYAALLLLMPMGSFAQSEDIFNLSIEQLLQTPVYSASRLSQTLSDSPNAMTVIDRKMIAASGFRNLTDVFKLVPGMFVSYYAGSQGFTAYHGALSQDSQGMQVLIDGRSVYLPPFNIVDWALLPITLDDIERIEVIRGPAAASYGENSVHGVINIITRDAGALDGASVAMTRGNKGINDVTAQFGRPGEKLDYRMTLAYRADNGYDDLSSPPNNMAITYPGADSLLNNTNDSNQARLLNYRAAYHPNAVDDFQVQLGYIRDVQGVGFWDSTLDKQHDMLSSSDFQQLDWKRQAGDDSQLSVRYYRIQHSTSEDYRLGTPSYPVSTSMKTLRNEIELQHTLKTSETNRVAYGAGYRLDQIKGNSHYPAPGIVQPDFPTSFSFSEYRVYANDEWKYSSGLTINAGGMLENDAMNNRSFSPRVSLNFHIAPMHTVRAGMSVAHRTPSLGERNANAADQYWLGIRYEPGPTITSPGLVPEKAVSRELGYLGEFRKSRTSLDLRLYNDQYENLLYPGLNFWNNGMTASYTGVEATLKQLIGESGELTLNYAHASANSNFSSLNPGKPDKLALSIPKNTVSLLYVQRLSHDLLFSTAYYLRTATVGFDRDLLDYQPTQHRTDIRLAKSFGSSGGLKGEVTAVVQNLFNTAYTEYIATALFNRRAYVTLTLRQ